jgi:hypothetical protein
VADPAPQSQEDEGTKEPEVYNPPNDVQETLVPEIIDAVLNSAAVTAPSSVPPLPTEEAPKKSYASIVSFKQLLSCIHFVERQGLYSNRGHVCKC